MGLSSWDANIAFKHAHISWSHSIHTYLGSSAYSIVSSSSTCLQSPQSSKRRYNQKKCWRILWQTTKRTIPSELVELQVLSTPLAVFGIFCFLGFSSAMLNFLLSSSPFLKKISFILISVIFLDWDDTLLCSSVLSGQGIRLDSNLEGATDLLRQLDELSGSVIDVLNVALSYGEVRIVTNGETGWVQLSAQKFLPKVVPYLDKVHIMSARSTFENLFPDSPVKWKFHAFQESLAKVYTDADCMKNVLSFGDSHAEREAIRAVTRGLPNTRTKSIKFAGKSAATLILVLLCLILYRRTTVCTSLFWIRCLARFPHGHDLRMQYPTPLSQTAERPSIEQLQRQLELVCNCFQYINNHEDDLDLCMSLSVTPNNNQDSIEAPNGNASTSEVVA